MADAAAGKAAKKNAKRKAAKKKKVGGGSHDDNALEPQEMMDILKKQLEIAKQEKDHEQAGKLRDQIWVLTDLVNGIRTDIPEKELLPILHSIELANEQRKGETSESEKPTSTGPGAALILTPEEKKVRTLKKKLQQIDTLKEKQLKGEKLEESQIDKIQSEEKIKEEIEELEELLENALSLAH